MRVPLLAVLSLQTATNAFVTHTQFISKHAHYQRQHQQHAVLTLQASQNNDNESLSLYSKESLMSNFMNALDESEQYEAVLCGLCAKILDNEQSEEVLETLKDPNLTREPMEAPLDLVKEMNKRNVKLSPRGLMALTDAASSTESAMWVNQVISVSKRNRSNLLKTYGSSQSDLKQVPRNVDVNKLNPIPLDNRSLEAASAFSFLMLSVYGLSSFDGANYVGWLLIVVLVFDNFFLAFKFLYELWDNYNKNGVGNMLSMDSFFLSLNKNNDCDEIDGTTTNYEFGRGQITKILLSGVNRLINSDTMRMCEVEAAAFYMGYRLGLPCFGFQCNSLEGAVLAMESTNEENDLDTLLSSAGVLKLLVWLFAPVAMEQMNHPELLASDPKEAIEFVKRLREKGLIKDMVDDDHLLLLWAYNEASRLLRLGKKELEQITERLAGGAATVGDCVAVLEQW